MPILLIFLLLVIIKTNIDSLIKSLRNENKVADLKKELVEEGKKNQFLKEKLLYVKTDQFVEREAREKLGLTKKGEYFVIAPTSTPLNQEKIVIDTKPNWRKWLDLFF
ncbi:MAG: hypothetical protein A3G66_00540 [Candidatus Levybacteria bacterium RIFCSPLOWO2_12_FULL_39_17]|nr:MAG: Septum formation initiator [Candidatus Levybacteria bacterium GW2011_GWA1_39_11]OGH15333.1 MAG: hypothetical protein A2689_01755 [Candidatus Levybacteria bacterium RIFCSPHIGHO2_01_FULL_38_96]OGH45468.1 MAG: hypothetical protein A3H82_03765 [Candidatus Levybacteria bacterium RIFCSPLOWO2_02_FULL_39_26]OGH48471.1 MAG: hypothetical protein A3G66_00540 [Candidatus Levybacteria bacterium RIFCSPLOWO2_12_FULL_39_17]